MQYYFIIKYHYLNNNSIVEKKLNKIEVIGKNFAKK